MHLMHKFNECKQKNVRTSNVQVANELMLALRPRTKKTGNPPHLSFVKRKSEDLGTELKIEACPELEIM